MTTILIVEDDDDLRRIMRWGLEAEGFEVALAADGQQALEAVFEVRPDLVVLDWELPALSGIEVCTLIRNAEHSTGIPVVMVSGRYEADDIRRGIEAGADAYVTKPFAVETLAQEIRRVLDRSPDRMVLTQTHFTGVDGRPHATADPGGPPSAADNAEPSKANPERVPATPCGHRAPRRVQCHGRHGR
ncbi:MAG: response regulator [Acidimicrobiia bacterium]